MLFYQVFKSLKGKEVEVKMSNGIVLKGILQSIDHFYNIKLINVDCIDHSQFEQVNSLSSAFLKGSQVLYVSLPKQDVDLQLLHDYFRKNDGEK